MSCIKLDYSFHHNHFIFVIQCTAPIFYRSVLERFLQVVVDEYDEEKGLVYEAVKDILSKATKDPKAARDAKIVRSAFCEKNRRMTNIDKAMRLEPIQKAVWACFGFDENVPYPVMQENLLFGVLSDVVHVPSIREVLVSDKADEDYQSFMEMLAGNFKLRYGVFSEEAADSVADSLDDGKLPDP